MCVCVYVRAGGRLLALMTPQVSGLADHEATPAVAARHARKRARGLFDFNSISALVPQRQLSVVVSLLLSHHHHNH